jgi:hypothetical protein
MKTALRDRLTIRLGNRTGHTVSRLAVARRQHDIDVVLSPFGIDQTFGFADNG